jgi:hypothetical protein
MRALILTLGVSLCSLGVLVVTWSLCVVAKHGDEQMAAWWAARERARR